MNEQTTSSSAAVATQTANRTEHRKSISYSYPTSTNAKRYGYGKTGCWSVIVGKQPDSEKGQTEAVYPTREEALTHARRIQLPWSPLFANLYPLDAASEQSIPVAPIVDALTAQFSCNAATDPSNLVPALCVALGGLGK